MFYLLHLFSILSEISSFWKKKKRFGLMFALLCLWLLRMPLNKQYQKALKKDGLLASGSGLVFFWEEGYV